MDATTVDVKKTTVPAVPDAWRSFRTDMDRLLDRLAGGFGLPSLRNVFGTEPMFRFEAGTGLPMPAIDVTEDAAAYKITAELPGMTEQDIEVALSEDGLTIKGEKKQEKEQTESNYYLSERSYGAFRRSFALPAGIDRDGVTAGFAKGVLTVTLPKTAEVKAEPKKVEVKAAA